MDEQKNTFATTTACVLKYLTVYYSTHLTVSIQVHLAQIIPRYICVNSTQYEKRQPNFAC